MTRLAATTALLSLLAAPAFAGALIFEPAPEPQVTVVQPAPMQPAMMFPTWTGPYAGVHAGWGWGNLDGDVAGVGVDIDDDGFNYGVQAGYDYDFGGFVLGGEASYTRLDLSFDDGVATDIDIDQVIRLTARGGFGFGNTLAYVRGGGAWLDGDGDDFGWVAGAGIEQRITPNVSAGLEYLYHRANDFDDTGLDATVQTVNLRLNYRF